MVVISPYEAFKLERFELADGMKNVTMESSLWGFTFTWNNLPIIGGNILFVEREVDTATMSEIIKWYNQDDNHRIAFANKQLVFDNFDLDDDLVFLKRKKQKVRAPFLPNYTVRYFSFDSRDLRIDSRKMTSSLAYLVGDAVPSRTQVERFIGGVLHMLNGKIWVLENIDETILSAVLYGTVRKDDYVYLELFEKNDKVVNEELFIKLLKSTFESYDTTPIYTHCIQNSPTHHILEELNFHVVNTMKITQ